MRKCNWLQSCRSGISKNKVLPAFSGSPELIFVASGQPIIVKRNQLWRLDEARNEWVLITWQPSGKIVGVITNGQRPYLLLETNAGQGVNRVEIYPDATIPPVKTLPALSVPLANAKGAVLGGVLNCSFAVGCGHLMPASKDIRSSCW